MLGFISQVSTENKAIKLQPVYKMLALTVLLKQFGLGARSLRGSGQSDIAPPPLCQWRVMRGWGQGTQEARPALPLPLCLTLGCPKVYNL